VNSTVNSSHTPRHAAASPLNGVRSVPADGNMPHGQRRSRGYRRPQAPRILTRTRCPTPRRRRSRTGHADGTAVSPDPSDLVVLICPAGAESAPISHGDRNWPAYPETPGDPHSRWLVGGPGYVSYHLCRVGGFVPLKAA
jgi:hypothetical protein